VNDPTDAAHGHIDGRETGLSSALRTAASRAAQCAGDGVTLLFVAGEGPELGTPAQLRAAAGFDTPEQARQAAEALRGSVQQVMESGGEATLAGDALGPRARGGATILPIAFRDRVHGALVAGSAGPLGEGAHQGLAGITASLALRLDHAHLAAVVAGTQRELLEKRQAEEQKNEEVLSLSEALFAQDIELLQNNEKLGKIEKLKSDFIEKMSRELRTPLNSIIESIIQVLAGENESLSATAQSSLRCALDEGTSFLRTLQNILDLWRIKQRELPVEIQEVNFREVVEEAIFSIQDTLGDKPVEITKCFAGPFPKIRTDLAKVNQILFLLLDNAAKFTTSGKIEIEARVEDGELVCEIRDTGIGVCSDDQEFIFDEFFQVDDSSSTKYRGAGLGLALVRDLLGLLAGGISLSSEVGVGTRVEFHLPVQQID
jgi:signal transduction histidine kinase